MEKVCESDICSTCGNLKSECICNDLSKHIFVGTFLGKNIYLNSKYDFGLIDHDTSKTYITAGNIVVGHIQFGEDCIVGTTGPWDGFFFESNGNLYLVCEQCEGCREHMSKCTCSIPF